MDVQLKRDICTKKPWYRITPTGYMTHGGYTNGLNEVDITNYDVPMPTDRLKAKVRTQEDFLREFYPSGHRINSEQEYPDIWKKDPETGRFFCQKIQRTAFAFQQLIAQKHILHLTGNDVQMELSTEKSDDKEVETFQKLLRQLKCEWTDMDMETRFFEAVRSWQITADCAIVGFIRNDGKTGAKTLSYMYGDTLYPQFDSVTGELILFGRTYYDYDSEGTAKIKWLEVWDDTYLYRFNQSANGADNNDYIYELGEDFCVSGFNLVSKKPHGFPFIPVAYSRRDEGPCWEPVQSNIEDYEEAFSYLCENNKAYAFPIFYYQGEGEDLQVQGGMNGAVKAIAMSDTEAKAGFLNGTDASNAFATQLDKNYNLIYELSFTVKPPELKSGDLPGAAIKLLYSPALEIAMNDAQALSPFLHKCVRIVKYTSGYKNDNQVTMLALPTNTWIQVFTHHNEQEEITNIATAVQNKFLSKRTASERCPSYPVNGEYERIMEEQKRSQEQDLLMDIRRQEAQVENELDKEEGLQQINHGKSGSDINTGRSPGRPNLSGLSWDENGNFPGESNWDKFNATH